MQLLPRVGTLVSILWISCVSSIAQTGAPPIPPIQSLTDIGTVSQSPLIQGRSGAYSALFNGKSYWLFDDTNLTEANASGDSSIDNSMAWTGDLDASKGITLSGNYVDSTGVPAEFIPYLPWEEQYNFVHSTKSCTASPCGAEFALWPGPVVPDPARSRTLIFYNEIWRIAGQSKYTPIGTGIAIWQNGKITRPVVNPGTRYPTLLWAGSQTGYADGWVTSEDTLYTYGCVAGFLVQDCGVASVALENATVPADWSYYTASGTWSANPTDASTIFQGGVSNSVFYDDYLGVYVAIYSGVLSNDVLYRVSYTPWGPWSNQTLVFTGLLGYLRNADFSALAHPEFAQANGQVEYVTYVRDTGLQTQALQLVQITFGLPEK
jgi:hypothetical protein